MPQPDQVKIDSLVNSLVASNNSAIKGVEGSSEVSEILFKKLLHKISCANPAELNAIEQSLNSIENEDIKDIINKKLQKAYLGMHNEFLEKIQTISPKVVSSYNESLEELRDHIFLANPSVYNQLVNNIRFKEMMDTGMLSDKIQKFPNVDGTNIQEPVKQGLCISLLNKQLANPGETWQELRGNLLNTIKAGYENKFKDGSSYISSLTQEKSPIFRAFKDFINSLVEDLGFRPFDKSKVQLFKETLGSIKGQMSIKELDELPINSISPK